MKKKYKTQDDRIVELDDEEFLKFPKNARLRLMDKVERVKVEPEIKNAKYKKELRELVGLSINRTKKVMEKFPIKEDLIKNLKKLPFEDIENKVLKDYYLKKGEK